MADNRFYDALETRDPAERQAAQWAALQAQISHAAANSAYFGEILAGVTGTDIKSAADLAKLPVTRKSDLAARQKAKPPFGGLEAVARAKLKHVFQSPGPIYEPDGYDRDHWRFARAMWAAGLRPGDLVLNCFSYHLTPAGMLVESAAHAIGCPVIPGGVGNTELQLQAVHDLKPDAYGGTPSFLRILLQKGREMGQDVSSLKKALVGGEALPPSLRKEINDLGCFVLQNYGTADLGLVAYESPAMEGMILDEGVWVEIVRPGTGDPVAPGEVGEVVVTTLTNKEYPLIRFATGDLSAVLAGTSPCGRTNTRIKGWMGRADQTTKVKGMFVTPGQIAQVVARHAEIAKARLEVTSTNNTDAMVLKIELKGSGADITAAVAETLQAVCKVRGSVEAVAAGSLPNDGKVIADLRTYQ
jgi:phenylacetate-CoA ligase